MDKEDVAYMWEAKVNRSVVDSLDPRDCTCLSPLSVEFSRQDKNTGVGCHFLLQGIFPAQGSNLGLLIYIFIYIYINVCVCVCVCVCMYKMEHASVIKNNKIMPFTETWIEIIILCEVSQTEKNKYHMISHMWNLKHDTNELIYKTETGSQTQRTGLWLPGERGWGGLNWEFGVSRCQLIYIEWVNRKVLLHCTGNCIQYPGVSSDGKEYVCMCTYRFMYIIHIISM